MQGGPGGTRAGLQGREGELGQLGAAVDAAVAGAGRAILLEGPAGIGKTALLRELRASLPTRGVHVLSARASDLESAAGYGVVRRLLEPLSAQPERFVGAAARAAEVLGDGPTAHAVADEFSAVHGLYWLLADAAETEPVVVLIDDVQWADGPSLHWLAHLVSRLDGLPVLLVLTVRSGEASLSAGPVARLAADPAVEVIGIGPLPAESVTRLVRDGLGDAPDALVEACAQATGGNPFYLHSLIGELQRNGGAATAPQDVRNVAPMGIVRSVVLRLEGLGEDAVALAHALAALGDEADLRAAAAVAKIDLHRATTAADALAAVDLLEPARPLRFRHPLLRAAILESLAPSRRSPLRRRAARQVLESSGRLDIAAGHLLATDPSGDQWTAETLRRAAADATSRGTPATAAAYLRRALLEPVASDAVAATSLELAAAAAAARDPDALALAQRAMDVVERPEDQMAAALSNAHMYSLLGRMRDGVHVLHAALRLGLPPEQETVARSMLLAFATMSLDAQQLLDPDMPTAAETVAALGDDAPLPMVSLAGFEEVTGGGGSAARARELATRAWAGGAMLATIGPDTMFVSWAAVTQVVVGEFATGESYAEAIGAEARRRGTRVSMVASSAVSAWARVARGDLRGAEVEALASLGHLPQEGLTIITMVPAQALLRSLVGQGRIEEAEAALEYLPGELRDPRVSYMIPWLEGRAELRLAQGRPHEALADLEACAAWEREAGALDGIWSAWRPIAVEAHLALGDQERAAAVAQDALDLARAHGAAPHLGRALRATATVLPQGRRDAVLLEALEVLDGAAMSLEAARCRILLARERHAAGKTGATTLLREALEAADAVGAAPVGREAADLLAAHGERVGLRAASGAAALTPAERRVAGLAAGEHSNREIAQALFLTTKTVENHLTSAYRKLGIHSRSELAAALPGETTGVS